MDTYEKKYNDALEKARIYRDNAKAVEEYAAAARYENIFPELRESEDERIRKAIFKALSKKEARDVLLAEGVQVSEALDYLEKQKENHQNADSISADCVSSAKCEDRSPKHTDSFGTDIRDTPAYWRGWDDAMKQKEQKPNYCHHEVDETGWTEEYRKAYYDGWNNCNMQHEQLKADHKPAEWSEEEEQMFGNILNHYSLIEAPTDGNGISKERYLAFIKSLRPSWKPSEEQMDALERASTNKYLSAKQFDILVSLNEQLKKL